MNRADRLEKEVMRHRALYYQGRPEISDAEYDQIEEELKILRPESYVFQLVGASPRSGKKIKHDKKMLSLEKTYDYEDLKKWIDGEEVVSTLKIDGVSCSLIYEKGQLKLAKTRGDGTYGEDIFLKVLWIDDIPKKIPEMKKIEIRGEIYCSQTNFLLLADEMVKAKLERPTSPRNIVAGLMGRIDRFEFSRYLGFFAFEQLYNGHNSFSTEWNKIKEIKEFGFKIPQAKLHVGYDDLDETLNAGKTLLAKGEFQVDGIVFTYNNIQLHEELGCTSHHPRYKLAFKFPGVIKQTIIEEIEWSVSRNGILTPVAIVVPVELSGALISRVTLHNFGMVRNFELKSGDEIEILRSGEVIPKFLRVVKKSDGIYRVPEFCPVCESLLKEDAIRLFCTNPNCPGRNKESILNFIHKIGIENLSSKRVEELMRWKLVKDIPDLYRLKIDDFLSLEKIKDKLAQKLYEGIQKTKDVDIIKFLSSLGIRGGAYNKCEKIVNAGINTIERIFDLKEEDLLVVDSFAEKSAKEFYFSLKERFPIIKELLDLGFEIRSPEKDKDQLEEKVGIKGRSFCITGALKEKRSVIEEKIQKAGGKVNSSVSKNTNFLVTNEIESTSSKFIQAKKLNIPIISEVELEKLLQG